MEEWQVKRHLIGIIIIITLGLTGCASKSVSLTEKENDMIAEYIAGKLLQYDKEYDKALVYNQDIAGEETIGQEPIETGTNTPVPTVSTTPTTPTVSTAPEEDPNNVSATVAPTYVELSQVFNKKEFNITYSKFDYYSSYPKDSKPTYFTFEASKDNQLIIVEFDITNLTDKSDTLNLIKSNIKYQIIVNEENTYSSLLTVLENDISYLNMKLDANETEKAVLAFEVPKNSVINNLSLLASKDDNTAMIKLK